MYTTGCISNRTVYQVSKSVNNSIHIITDHAVAVIILMYINLMYNRWPTKRRESSGHRVELLRLPEFSARTTSVVSNPGDGSWFPRQGTLGTMCVSPSTHEMSRYPVDEKANIVGKSFIWYRHLVSSILVCSPGS